mmetsp:Transcript_28805/g.95734  ORF Transcript_28805/g.95734 Transcript_28805/m.95734 type:complete len:152 (+) Transcript_28805:120-575(+)
MLSQPPRVQPPCHESDWYAPQASESPQAASEQQRATSAATAACESSESSDGELPPPPPPRPPRKLDGVQPPPPPPRPPWMLPTVAHATAGSSSIGASCPVAADEPKSVAASDQGDDDADAACDSTEGSDGGRRIKVIGSQRPERRRSRRCV